MQTNSLVGKTFFICQNNGIVALASAETVSNISRRNLIGSRINHEYRKTVLKALSHLSGAIFTFCEQEQWLDKAPWFTGNYVHLEFLKHYIEEHGGRVERGSFYVPFSNGFHSEECIANELAYVTSEEDYLENFGISTRGLNAEMGRALGDVIREGNARLALRY